jgi:N4-gp56 family major capsid protein
MATKSFATGDALTNKLWSAKLLREVEKKTYFKKFVGEGDDSIIQIKTETGKNAGDKVTFGLVMSLTGDGVTENQALEGNEEDLTTYDESLLVNELFHAARFKSKRSVSNQRTPYNLREVAKDRLALWWADRMDSTMFLHLAGYTGDAFTRDGRTVDPDKAQYNGMNTIVAPTAGRRVWADNNTADEGLTSATDDKFALELIDEALLIAKTAQPLVQPLMIDGDEKYICILHPSQVKDLRTAVSTTKITWYDTQKARVQGGEMKNGIFTGALGEYNGVVLHEAFRIPNGVNSSTGATVANTKRALLLGRQAGVIGYGRENANSMTFDWRDEEFDYGRSVGVSIGAVFGMKKTQFNSKDYGVITISTYGKDL